MKIKFRLMLAGISSILAIGCGPEITELDYADKNGSAIESLTIELSQTSLTLRETSTTTVSATVRPWSAAIAAVRWSSSNPEVATIDNNGLITAVSIGECVITAEAGNKKSTCNVTVVDWRIPAESIEFDVTSISLKPNESLMLNAVITPETTTDQLFISSSDDETVFSLPQAQKLKSKIKTSNKDKNFFIAFSPFSMSVKKRGSTVASPR